jgi:hypothetical protein
LCSSSSHSKQEQRYSSLYHLTSVDLYMKRVSIE